MTFRLLRPARLDKAARGRRPEPPASTTEAAATPGYRQRLKNSMRLLAVLMLATTLQAQTFSSRADSVNTIKNASFCADTSVSANTITCTTAVGFVGYVNGQSVDVLLKNSATGATTININGLGAKAVTINGATAITTGILVVGGTYRFTYDATEFVVQGPVTVLTSAAIIATFTGTCNSSTVLTGGGTCAAISSSFSTLTSGVNTTAVMQTGPGASLSIGGTIIGDFSVISTSTSVPRGIVSAQFSTTTDSARLSGYKARGTQASPTTVVTGDIVTRYAAFPYDGANFLECGDLVVTTEGTIAATQTPTNIAFQTCTNAAPSVLTEAMRINSAQNVGIGTGATISAALHISRNGALSTGNGPAMKLDGTWITGGSVITTKPYVLIEPAGTTSGAWSTAGTGLGVNAATGFTGNLIDLQLVGVSKFSVTSAGGFTAGSNSTVFGTLGVTVGITAGSYNGTSASVTTNLANYPISTPSLFPATLGAGTHTETSGFGGAVRIIPTYNQTTGTAANTDLLVNRTNTAVGNGAQLFVSYQVATVQKYSVDILGNESGNTTKTNVFTVATLPTCGAGQEGTVAGASDLLTPTFLVAAVGGGAVHGQVYCNGTTWVAE